MPKIFILKVENRDVPTSKLTYDDLIAYNEGKKNRNEEFSYGIN